MKPLKSIVEGILGNLDADIENATVIDALSNHPMTAHQSGWGDNRSRYNIKGDTLSILSSSTMPWICNDTKFWELIKSAGINHIESNYDLVFYEFDFDIDRISIDTSGYLFIKDCNAIIKNCELNCFQLNVRGGGITLDKVNIKTNSIMLERSTLNQKNTSINCKTIHIKYDKLKGTDWGNYIESLGAIKITPSGKIKVLNEKVELNEDFAPLIPSTAERYYIYTGIKHNRIVFETINASYGLMFFKNGWIGRFDKR